MDASVSGCKNIVLFFHQSPLNIGIGFMGVKPRSWFFDITAILNVGFNFKDVKTSFLDFRQ